MSELTDRLKYALSLPKTIIHDDGKWHLTNDLLNDMSKVQDCLASAGVQQGDRIVVSFPNSYKFVCLYLAIIDYGAIVVPINPNMPEYEFISFIQRCRPAGAFIGTHHADILINSQIPNLTLNTFFVVDAGSFLKKRYEYTDSVWVKNEVGGKAVHYSPYQTSENSVAVLLYTSGTTGRPKAVGLTHGQILAAIENIIDSHELSQLDVTFCFLPLFHINAQVVAVLSTILSKGKMVIAPKFSASKFWDVINEHKVTWVSGVPAVISILLNTPRPEHISSSLRFIRSASSQLPMVNARRFEQQFGVPVIQSYGMTEAASQICVNPLPPNKRVLGSVGLPVGLELKIVDPDGRKCLPNSIGEIVIKGKNVINHYIEADSQKDFRDGWFHTGDLGYVDKEGFVFIVGRIKEMINRGGEKVSPYEVEDVIRQIPAVKDAAVIGIPHQLYGEMVVSYIVCHKNQGTPNEIIDRVIAHCRNSLSGYKCPSEVYAVDEIPVGPTGKIQRTRLRELSLDTYQNLKAKNMS
ncbi:AMP-binding protein [Neobacillus muris]|uniref:AMP-binding protein n=1 Tax=Neobacillus muris TaxID=2941334 RepID=UPI00203B9040|nr:AMP-binding protein [Neobacillus muris]